MASSDDGHLSSHPCIYVGHMPPSRNMRRSWFMKWISKLFGGGSSRGASNGRRLRISGEENTFWHEPARSMDDQSKAEKEELDRAIALSLAENGKRRNGQCDNDEDLDRALRESLSMSASHPYNPVQCVPRDSRVCGGCNKEIGYGHYLSCMGAFWHPQCFRCHACGLPICEKEFSLSGSHPYHKSCHKELHHPKCDVCHQFIPTNRSGLIEYRAHPFWRQNYCPSHEHDNTPRCCSCERLETRSVKYISLGDGRSLCLECLDSAIMDTGECQPLYHSIRDYYEGMYMKIDQQIPMLLVERQALNEAIEGEKDGHHHMPETRGLCLSEEQTVSSIHRKPKIGGNRVVDMRTHPQKLTRRCEVTAILVLYGLPRLLTGSILAHELMHGWLRLKGYRNLSPVVEEGICQVLSHMWLESEVMPESRSMPATNIASSSSSLPSSGKKGGKSDIEKRLGEFFLHQIAHDISPAYGEGFRAANAAVLKFGLRRTLDHIRFTGGFPE
ncbi:protein DA1-related 2-like isoform X1 [Dioscorea cayenensis subsp. rotundata]|uniref:Protein DA1-related 2-like isoform X1 n=2 Tax=Dioscorea cayennensis subsp. rotundata TaxID=55577 RepID=A0AB40BWQ7_DIOCR|nr:protein DA1-related 2-like isoform X1 [Dioscorea cayenensis subsp. rotundata]